jgi:stringent starvation protein B
MTSSRPYLIRAMYDWIIDNNLTPHVVVDAKIPGVIVPEKYVVDGRMILNVSSEATRKLIMNNEAIEFDARFSGLIWHVYAPINAVLAVYAQENGRGMMFEEDDEGGGDTVPPTATPPKLKPSRPHLKIVK